MHAIGILLFESHYDSKRFQSFYISYDYFYYSGISSCFYNHEDYPNGGDCYLEYREVRGLYPKQEKLLKSASLYHLNVYREFRGLDPKRSY